MNRKFLLMILVLLLSISLVACGGKDGTKEPEVTVEDPKVEEVEEVAEEPEAEENEEEIEDINEIEIREVDETPDPEQIFSSMEIEISEGYLEITMGEEYSITREDGTEVLAEIVDSKLSLVDNSYDRINLVIPFNYEFENIKLSLKGGKIFMEQAVKVENLDISVEKGNVSFEYVNIDDLKVTVNRGSAIVRGTVEKDANLHCTDGNIFLGLNNNLEDYNVYVELHKGNVRVGEQSFHGMDSTDINNEKDKNIDIYCSQGHVEVEF